MTNSEFLDKAKEKKITNIQVVEVTQNMGQIELINTALETFEISDYTSYQIKAEYNNKTVKVSSDYLDENILDVLITKATETDSKYQDEYLQDTFNNNETATIPQIEMSKDLEILRKLDDIRKQYKEVSNLTLFYSETYTKKRIFNSNGVNIETASHTYEFVPEIVVLTKDGANDYDKVYLKTSKDELNMEYNLKKDMEMAIKQATKEKLQTKKYNVIIDSTVMSYILSNMIKMISADSIRLKVSCLENKLNQKIFSDKITIIENPTDKKYPGMTKFDNEGTLTARKEIVKEGVLKTYLYNIKEAKVQKKKTTGNGYNGISTKNMYIMPGDKSLEELFKKLKNGIYITDCMGSMGMAINANTGTISLQVFGFIIENGQIKCGFVPSIMTTTIYELLTQVEDISKDVIFDRESTGSPCLLIKGISIVSHDEE